jgi:hypothetical protein
MVRELRREGFLPLPVERKLIGLVRCVDTAAVAPRKVNGTICVQITAIIQAFMIEE